MPPLKYSGAHWAFLRNTSTRIYVVRVPVLSQEKESTLLYSLMYDSVEVLYSHALWRKLFSTSIATKTTFPSLIRSDEIPAIWPLKEYEAFVIQAGERDEGRVFQS